MNPDFDFKAWGLEIEGSIFATHRNVQLKEGLYNEKV